MLHRWRLRPAFSANWRKAGPSKLGTLCVSIYPSVDTRGNQKKVFSQLDTKIMDLFFRDQQFKESVHNDKEETVKLLPVTTGRRV